MDVDLERERRAMRPVKRTGRIGGMRQGVRNEDASAEFDVLRDPGTCARGQRPTPSR